jgi:hypothetical protein
MANNLSNTLFSMTIITNLTRSQTLYEYSHYFLTTRKKKARFDLIKELV